GLKVDRAGPFTIEAWVTPQFAKNSGFNVILRIPGQASLRTSFKGDAWSFLVTQGEDNEPLTGVTINPKKKVHLAGVRSGDEIRLYVDGKLEASKRIKPRPLDEAKINAVMGGLAKGPFKGLIHALRVSSVARYTVD